MREKRGATKKVSKASGSVKSRAGMRRKATPIDWERVDAISDTDIAEQIRQDPDDIEFTDQMLAAARWVMPQRKIPISFRVDPDILAYFRSGGDGYQSRMNAVLRGYMRGHVESAQK